MRNLWFFSLKTGPNAEQPFLTEYPEKIYKAIKIDFDVLFTKTSTVCFTLEILVTNLHHVKLFNCLNKLNFWKYNFLRSNFWQKKNCFCFRNSWDCCHLHHQWKMYWTASMNYHYHSEGWISQKLWEMDLFFNYYNIINLQYSSIWKINLVLFP